MLKPLLLIAFAMGLSGCGEKAEQLPRAAQSMRAAVAEQVDNGPSTRAHRIGASGELFVLEVPSATARGLILETQQCFVWRDTEFRTATMSCPHPPQVTLPEDGRDTGHADSGL